MIFMAAFMWTLGVVTVIFGHHPEASTNATIYVVGGWIIAALAELRDAIRERR